MTPSTVVLDLDGTLVDSVYVHVLAWRSAFRDVGLDVAAYRLHGLIGMGGDRLVEAAAGPAAEASLGEEIRAHHQAHLDRHFGLVVATPGATELLEGLRAAGAQVVLASSSDRDLTERLLDLVEGVRPLLSGTVTGSDAEQSKPSGELVEVALRSVGATDGVVVGDAVWDVRSAQDAGVPCVGLLTGGIDERALRDAGAVAVHASPRELAESLRVTGSLLPS